MTDLGIPGIGDATLIASGGSALVYEAVSGTGERVAIKLLRGVRGADVHRRFEREITAAERLGTHQSIIQILHTGITAAGEPFLVMPLVAGGSLQDELDRAGAFPLHQATGDVATAAQALHFAHERGVLHRDIKPANLLRAEDGSIVVTDFGIARVIDAGITSASVGAHTPLYAAPEVLAENKASIRSEVYGLAALLYALLAGRPAFGDTENIWATLNRIPAEVPAPIVGVPAPVMRVIHQAMAKNPSDRPASAAMFRENLRVALTAPNDWVPPAPTTELGLPEVVLGPSRHDTLLGGPTPPSLSGPVTPAPGQPPRRGPEVLAPTTTFDRPYAPPAPPVGRRTPAVGPSPAYRDSSTAKILAATAALLLIGGLAWWGTARLLSPSDVSAVIEPPVDTSLPPPDPQDNTNDEEDDAGETEDDDMSIDDLPPPPQAPTTFVSFTGDHFSALLPEGWSLAARDIEESYGFRSMFVTDGMYLNIDTTPKEQREPGGDIAQSARDIASNIASASEVRTEEVDGLVMHSFTFRNNRGEDSIDIFFEVDGDGYAVVAGSAIDPDTAFATARLVALSVRSNPS